MKKNIAKNLLVVMVEIAYLVLAGTLAGCPNQSLQVEPDSASQAAPGIVGTSVSPPIIGTVAPIKSITVVFIGNAEPLSIDLPMVPGYIDTFCSYYYDFYEWPGFFLMKVYSEGYSEEYGRFPGSAPEEFTLIEEYVDMGVDIFYVFPQRKL